MITCKDEIVQYIDEFDSLHSFIYAYEYEYEYYDDNKIIVPYYSDNLLHFNKTYEYYSLNWYTIINADYIAYLFAESYTWSAEDRRLDITLKKTPD